MSCNQNLNVIDSATQLLKTNSSRSVNRMCVVKVWPLRIFLNLVSSL